MYNLASKLLGPLGDPLVLALALSACALLAWKRRRLAFRLLIASFALLLIFSSSILANALQHSLEDHYPDPGDNPPQAQAIVVLGGTLHMPYARHHTTGLIESSDRLLLAFRLYRAGKAPLVFCSGGNNPIGTSSGQLPEATWMARLLEEWNIPATAIQQEGGSINTRDNALMSYQALSPRGIHRILLVTSAMHMPRAAGAFRKAGFEVIAAPADFRTGWGQATLSSRLLPSVNNLLASDQALHEWLGILVYRLRGWM